MTAALDLHPDSTHPVLTGVHEVHRLLDEMHAHLLIAPGTHAKLVAELDRAGRRLAALRLKVVAAADTAGAPADAGYAGTESWVARHTTTPPHTAAQEVGLARDLDTGAHDATADALDAGLVSPAHAQVILRAASQLPDGVTDAQRQQVEAALVEKAQRYDPDQLRRHAKRAIAEIEPDQAVVDAHEDQQLRTEEEAARAKTRLTFHDNADGTVTGHFTVPAVAAAFLRKVIESMTSPRRMRVPAQRTSTQPTTLRSARHFDWDHRRGLAFTELLEHLPTDHLHDKTAATVVVTIDHDALTGALKAAHLDTGQDLSSGEARRLACTAGIIPAVLGTGSVALDLGRETRLFTQAQRVAVGLRHDTCATDGCDRPYAWAELHHREPWATGGRTDLNNAVPVCAYHHQRIHDPGFWHRYPPDGTISMGRRT